jgi:hypothetical protein
MPCRADVVATSLNDNTDPTGRSGPAAVTSPKNTVSVNEVLFFAMAL